MGSALYQITCTNCGSRKGWQHDEYKEGINTIDCDDCDYYKKRNLRSR